MNQVMANISTITKALLMAGLLCLSQPSFAINPQTAANYDDYSAQPVAEKGMTAAEAARIAKARHGGKVLGVNRQETDSGVVFKVRLLQDNGRVKTVTIRG